MYTVHFNIHFQCQVKNGNWLWCTGQWSIHVWFRMGSSSWSDVLYFEWSYEGTCVLYINNHSQEHMQLLTTYKYVYVCAWVLPLVYLCNFMLLAVCWIFQLLWKRWKNFKSTPSEGDVVTWYVSEVWTY